MANEAVIVEIKSAACHQVNSPAAGKYKPVQGGLEFRSHHREPTSPTEKQEVLLKCYTALRGGRGGTGGGVGWEFASGVSLGLCELVAFPVFYRQLTMGSVFF